MAETVLRVEHVGMRFNLSKERVDSLKDYILKSITRQMKFDEFWALKDINFTLEKGERIGILGTNGAGKSTLLKVIAGVFKPTEGSVVHKGKIVPLLELGAGFDKEYTGRENIYLYGAVLGYSKEFIDSKFDEIVKFSGLKKFLDVPLKNYSSGMKSRLGFSIATIVEPEILILDEIPSKEFAYCIASHIMLAIFFQNGIFLTSGSTLIIIDEFLSFSCVHTNTFSCSTSNNSFISPTSGSKLFSIKSPFI